MTKQIIETKKKELEEERRKVLEELNAKQTVLDYLINNDAKEIEKVLISRLQLYSEDLDLFIFEIEKIQIQLEYLRSLITVEEEKEEKEEEPETKEFLATIYYFPNGEEGEEMECNSEHFKSFEQAINYIHEQADFYAGLRFASGEIELFKNNKYIDDLYYMNDEWYEEYNEDVKEVEDYLQVLADEVENIEQIGIR